MYPTELPRQPTDFRRHPTDSQRYPTECCYCAADAVVVLLQGQIILDCCCTPCFSRPSLSPFRPRAYKKILLGHRARSNQCTLCTSTLLFQGQIRSDPRKNPTATHLLVLNAFQTPAPTFPRFFSFAFLRASCCCFSLVTPALPHRPTSHLFDVSVVRFVQTCSRETPKRSSRYTW